MPSTVEGWQLWLPPPENRTRKWLNLNDRNHWSKGSPLTRYWREVACDRALEEGAPTWVYPHVTAYLAFGDNRRRDVHNYTPTVKASIDGLTDAGLWRDDCDGILTGPDMRRDETRAVGVTLWIREYLGENYGNF